MCTGPHPYIPVPDTAEVKLIFNGPGGKAMNVINFTKDGGWDTSSISDLAQAASDAWESEISARVSEDVSLDSVVATDLSSSTGPQTTLPAGISGGNANPVAPSNVTVAVSFHTAFRGRSKRGRLFHYGSTNTQITGDSIGDAGATATQEAYQNFFDAIAGDVSGATHVVVSRCQDGDWLTTGETTEVTSYAVDPIVDSQRRRLAGRGM